MSIRCSAPLAAMLAMATPAAATEFCELLPSPEGFAELRSSASPNARLIARMHAGDEVRALGTARGGWMEVYFWRDGDRLDPAKSDRYLHGWVRTRHIGECG